MTGEVSLATPDPLARGMAAGAGLDVPKSKRQVGAVRLMQWN